MSQLDRLNLEVTQLAETMKISFGKANLMQQQVLAIKQMQGELIQTKTDLAPYLEKLQAAIVKIDAIRVAKAAAGIVLLLVSSNSDSDDGDLFTSVFSEITNEIGNELLDQAIHSENELRQVYQHFSAFTQKIDVLYQQSEQLKTIAETCLVNPIILQNLDNSPKYINLKDLENQFSQIAVSLKLKFTFGKPQLMAPQISSLNLSIQQLKQLKLECDRFQQLLEHNGGIGLSSVLLEALFSLFGSSITSVEYNDFGILIFTIGIEQHTISEICNFCHNLQQNSQQLVTLSEQFKQLAEQSVNYPDIIKLVTSTQAGISLNYLESRLKEQLENTPIKLTFSDFQLLPQQINQLKQFQSKLRGIQNKLEVATQKIESRESFCLQAKSLAALLALCGKFLSGVGFDCNGNLVIYHQDGNNQVEEFLKYCVSLKQSIKLPLIQSVYLIKLAEQCLNYSKLSQQLETANTSLSIADFKKQAKELTKRATLSLKFDSPQQIEQQLKEITEAGETLKQIQKNLETIVNAADNQVGLALNPLTISAIIFLFGSISGVSFNHQNQLVIERSEQSEKASDIHKFCTNLKPKVETGIQKFIQNKDLGENCLKDPALRKRLDKERKHNRFKIKAAFAASIIVLFSPVIWTGWVRYQQEILRMEVRSTVTQIAEANDILDWESLQASQQKLREAIARLETVPNTFASAYPQAQTDITFVKSRLDNIEQRIKREEEASGNLETTKKLAIEAANLVQNPPHPVEVWQKAQVKWQTAIGLLEAIPDGCFVSVQAQEKLSAYRANYEAITKRLSTEEKAALNLSNATNLVSEVSKVLENPLHPLAVWQQTEAKLQKAIQLLETVPSSSPTFVQAQENLPTYRTIQAKLSQNLAVEEKATISLIKAENLAKQAIETLVTPPYTVDILQNAKSKFVEASDALKNISQESYVSLKASSLLKIYSSNIEELQRRIDRIQFCQRLEMETCFEAETPLNFNQSE